MTFCITFESLPEFARFAFFKYQANIPALNLLSQQIRYRIIEPISYCFLV